LLLDQVDYYQVVFTLPEVISTLALGNRQEIADVLFTSAWKALKKTITNEQGYDPAALMVLHTWNQKLESHWHVHALVPGGGPSLGDGSWKKATAPTVEGEADDRAYREQCGRALASSGLDHSGELREGIESADSIAACDSTSSLSCEHCGSEWLRLIEESAKPSWEQLLSRGSECSPWWYAESQKLDDIRFWDGAMGEGFSEWYERYLESELESGRESERVVDRPIQLTLPGFDENAGRLASQLL
jgi:hypothetical protein